jgi:hypothetical protein
MASKKGPLSKAEVFYIQEHIKSGKDINDIALDLDRAVKSVEKCATKAQKDIKQPKPVTAGDQFARRQGVTIMTENASSFSDAKRKKNSSISKSNSCVTKIKHD